MAYNPISGFTLQVITQTGEVASDYYLKFYQANTTTPLSMATDSAGGTLLVKAKLSDSGFPISNPLDNSTVFIPHMNANYRLVVYTSEADADADNTAAAYVNVPFVSTLVGASAVGTAAYLDTGTAAGELPTNGDLGTAAQVDTGTGAANVPTNAQLAPYLGRNLIINADFSTNQREVSGTVVLAAGEYGHDRFKAGASGCTYTFATSAGVTTITITAGTLLQIIEGVALPASDVILSWTGTAQGRIDSGSYGDSGAVTDTTTGGTNVTVEFDAGTLSHPQLERSDVVTDFEYVNPADQLARCKRYFERISSADDANTFICSAFSKSITSALGILRYEVAKRSEPVVSGVNSTFLKVATTGVDKVATSIGYTNVTRQSCKIDVTTSGLVAGEGVLYLTTNTTDYLDINAEL